MRTNRNGAITITLRPNATCDITIPGEQDKPVRCWICLTCDQPNVNAFAKVTRRTEAGLVPLIYQCSHTGKFYAIQFGGPCPVRDQVICVANTGRAASPFFLVLINKDGSTKAVKEVSLGGRNCRCLSLIELFPEYSNAFDGWLFAQFEFDSAVSSYAMGPDGNVFMVPVVENESRFLTSHTIALLSQRDSSALL